ncbi:hypothetical protein GCM10027277_05500 [Pseudoduganella ginsengisoli]|uniref:Toxin-antitoxin system YwqK family antitoxin n=1 Tax=Pseudoduganella ginsengisoli TaxID=1462440 RepID=A0A6L6Q460_9BURK|nr:hypothetical protein [Pseudoduganella ginsengisoli]MTW04249.1 hypothetical protein [Pseudoduganella ginsengisoli]
MIIREYSGKLANYNAGFRFSRPPFQRGKKHGPSAEQEADGAISWGDFDQGKRQGKTQIEHENHYTLDAMFDKGEMVGEVTVQYTSGTRYTGTWGAHGGTMEYALGGSYKCEWTDGRWAGNGMITYSNGLQRTLQLPALGMPERK